MHSRRIACLLLGMWLAGGFFMAWMATENFRSVDRLLNQGNPAALVRLRAIGPEAEGRALLRYEVSEQNRFYFESWEIIQVFLGGFLFLFLLFGTREGKVPLGLALFMMVLVFVQRFVFTPEITTMGRTLDFAPVAASAGEHAKFMLLHTAYVGMELAKWALGIALGLVLILEGRRRSRSVRPGLDAMSHR
jgi:hypothetical protein